MSFSFIVPFLFSNIFRSHSKQIKHEIFACTRYWCIICIHISTAQLWKYKYLIHDLCLNNLYIVIYTYTYSCIILWCLYITLHMWFPFKSQHTYAIFLHSKCDFLSLLPSRCHFLSRFHIFLFFWQINHKSTYLRCIKPNRHD